MASRNTTNRLRQDSPRREADSRDPANTSPRPPRPPAQGHFPTDILGRHIHQPDAVPYSVSLSSEQASFSVDPPIPNFSLPVSVYQNFLEPTPPMSPLSSPSSSMDRPPTNSSQSIHSGLFPTVTRRQIDSTADSETDNMERGVEEHTNIDKSSSLEAACCPPENAEGIDVRTVRRTFSIGATKTINYGTEEFSKDSSAAWSSTAAVVPDVPSSSTKTELRSSLKMNKHNLPPLRNENVQGLVQVVGKIASLDSKYDGGIETSENSGCTWPRRKKICDNSRGKRSNDDL